MASDVLYTVRWYTNPAFDSIVVCQGEDAADLAVRTAFSPAREVDIRCLMTDLDEVAAWEGNEWADVPPESYGELILERDGTTGKVLFLDAEKFKGRLAFWFRPTSRTL